MRYVRRIMGIDTQNSIFYLSEQYTICSRLKLGLPDNELLNIFRMNTLIYLTDKHETIQNCITFFCL